MLWLDWRELEKHNDWGVRGKDDATAALWNESADKWETRSAGELDFAARQVASLDISSDDCVLDVCCGTGSLTIELCRRAKHVTAFDFNENMLDYVRRKASEHHLENIDYLKGNFNTIVPGCDFEPADIAVTRHSPAQSNILKFSRFATKYCYSLWLLTRAKEDFPLPGRKGGRWCKSGNEAENYSERPDGRKYGFNITFNLLYESGANPEITYVDDWKTLTAESIEELAKVYFPNAQTPEILEYVRNGATHDDEGFHIQKKQTMSIMGWNPQDIDWDRLENLF